MAADFVIQGGESFLRLSKSLKAAGELGLRKELHKTMQVAARPLIPKARASARERLPRRGGLAERVAKSPMRVAVRTGRNPGVAIVVGKRLGIAQRATNRGTFRHPVFGNREVWVTQTVPADWFDAPMERNAPTVVPSLLMAVHRTGKKAAREAGL